MTNHYHMSGSYRALSVSISVRGDALLQLPSMQAMVPDWTQPAVSLSCSTLLLPLLSLLQNFFFLELPNQRLDLSLKAYRHSNKFCGSASGRSTHIDNG